jgi:hypothetical protein
MKPTTVLDRMAFLLFWSKQNTRWKLCKREQGYDVVQDGDLMQAVVGNPL